MVGRAFLVITLILYAFSVIGLQLLKDGMLHARCAMVSANGTAIVYVPNVTTSLQARPNIHSFISQHLCVSLSRSICVTLSHCLVVSDLSDSQPQCASASMCLSLYVSAVCRDQSWQSDSLLYLL